MKNVLTVENKIASELNAGTELSERKLAEKFETTRSVVRRVKANIEKYTVVEAVQEAKPEVKKLNTVEVINTVKAVEITHKAVGLDNIEKLLASKSANKKPAEISLLIFKSVKGDFELFSKQMQGKSSQYIKDQFLRSKNKLDKDSK
ncbi:GntR family transcriptional regulator [Citrobacter freundii]|uniref:GntR family transcriptional regulator n=1 Tax=Citrobacter freundii TaxID=546 RepID=UPI0018FF7C4D|nr:GntR family transcriptional regulator [Citrobacter freundii]MBJ8767526.1 GntR family transcriptional regulator [Citrobacter freundii]